MGFFDWLKGKGKLRACPNCDGTKYQYGFSIMSYIEECVDIRSTIQGVAEGNWGKVVEKGGGGIFTGIWKCLKNEVIDDIPSNPLLRCKKCFLFLIVCPHCNSLQLLKEAPLTAAIIECQECKGRFTHCESNPKFDSLVE